jgi:cyclic beta-1,2-glucan synthetase
MASLHAALISLATTASMDPASIADIRDAELIVANHLRTIRKESANEETTSNENGAVAPDTAIELDDIASRADTLLAAMDFGFLYDPKRKLLRIGYDVGEDRPDPNHYDLLASEARLASLIAVSKGDVPREHWLHLGRPLGRVGRRLSLLSWSGTMFEYLMPPLVMRERPRTLLGQSCRAVVEEQIRYGRAKGVPWGISESGYYQFDAERAYQYRAFGVPSLGFKRGLSDDLVVAPYASVLAIGLAPSDVLENLADIEALGGRGHFGLYEAIDFTADRLPPGEKHAVIRSYMAHHQGMILVAITNRLLDDPFVDDFHSEPSIQTAEMLLEERPTGHERAQPTAVVPEPGALPARRSTKAFWTATPDGPLPDVQLLSNGRLSSYLTAGGGGYLSWKGTRLTRWVADRTLEVPGVVILVGDRDTGLVWPLIPDVGDRVRFDAGSAEWRIAEPIGARVRVSISVDDDVEIRQVRLSHAAECTRRLRIMLVADISIVSGASDSHPAFSKLFVETMYRRDGHVVIARRRDNTAGQSPTVGCWAVGPTRGARSAGFETSRETFIGRHGNRLAPRGAWSLRAEVDTEAESPLDPIAVVALDVDLEPRASIEVAFMTAAAPSMSALLEVVARNRTASRVAATVASSVDHANVALMRGGGSVPQLQTAMALLAAATLAPTALRAARRIVERNTGGQSMLWRFAISGDVPIVVICLGASEDAGLVSEVVRAQGIWRARGLLVDVVVLSQRGASYDASVDERVVRLVHQAGAAARLGGVGGVFILHEERLSPVETDALLSAAQVVLHASEGPLASQLERVQLRTMPLPDILTSRGENTPTVEPASPLAAGEIGAFSEDGREYIIFLKPGQSTPAPWSNVLANDAGGCVLTESGGGYTWSQNAGENRLTPWNNDPLSDPPGEALYIRDEETCRVWSPTPQPAPSGASYEVRHGAGYTVFRNESHGVIQELRVGMAPDDSVKIQRLRLTNISGRARRFTITHYVEWVLGVDSEASRPRVVPSFDVDAEVMLLRNPWNAVFGSRVAFAATTRPLHGMTTDRTEFLGRRGSLSAPAALRRIGLASAVGSDHDVCSAMQVHVDLPAHSTEEVVFAIGQADTRAEAIELAKAFRTVERAREAQEECSARWDTLLGRVQVHTPNPNIDRLVNRWLLYQSISSRLMARTGFYQSSGAFGFRDQLQDVMALPIVDRPRYRAHLVEAARHQFEEGDVLHWWHPPTGAGVRTRCSDDLLWLPFAVAHYVDTTGDIGVLDEEIAYLTGPELRPEEVDRYSEFATGERTADLYRHCLDALERGERLGVHGLPLIGSGDWNDGMSKVGRDGSGESVWLAWFLATALQRFAPICVRRGNAELAEEMRGRARALVAAVEAHGWDGAWYKRGWFDDGTALGSSANAECRIDAISQSWAVISGGGDPERTHQALDAVQEQLVDEQNGLVLLLTPPFRSSVHDPGYIRAYPAGVRENGGQYTHAAIWTLWAIAQSGDPTTAMRLFESTSSNTHGKDRDTYRVEPYVVAADIYSTAPHAGRGGWTWYTGAAAWSYRLLVEQILGISMRDGKLAVEPNLPANWPGYEADILVDGATWRVVVKDGEVELSSAD